MGVAVTQVRAKAGVTRSGPLTGPKNKVTAQPRPKNTTAAHKWDNIFNVSHLQSLLRYALAFLVATAVHLGADARFAGWVPHLAVIGAFGVGVHPTRTGNVFPQVGAILIACLQLSLAIFSARDLGAKAAVRLAGFISLRAGLFAVREKLVTAIVAGITA